MVEYVDRMIIDMRYCSDLFESYKFCEYSNEGVRGNYFHEMTMVACTVTLHNAINYTW